MDGLNTRNANSLNVVPPKPNIQLYCQSLKYSGAKVWNLLPNNFQNAQSLDIFKKKIKIESIVMTPNPKLKPCICI